MRTCIIILLLSSILVAQEDPRGAYKQAKTMRGQAKKDYASEQASRFASSATGSDHRYMGYLWRWAGEPSKAADSSAAYLAEPTTTNPKNRAVEMLNRVISLLEAKRWSDVPAATGQYYSEFSGQKYTGRMRFSEGRAYRMMGNMVQAIEAFEKGSVAGYKLCNYEIVDSYVQLGRYQDASTAASETDDGSSRYSSLVRALPNLGKPMPKLPFDFWAGTELALSEVKEKPAVFAFWTTMGGKSRRLIHGVTNKWQETYSGKVNCIGPAVYVKFDPTTMRIVDEMTSATEQSFIADWHSQYNVKYSLALLSDSTLHELCGIDPAKPVLPAFAVSDKQGRLRYVRVGGSAWEIEAVETMIKRVASE